MESFGHHHFGYLLRPWQWQGSNGLGFFPLYHPSVLLHPSSHADVHPPLTFHHAEGCLHLDKMISEATFCASHAVEGLEIPRWSPWSPLGQSQRPSRSFNKLIWNKTKSSRFNGYQNVILVRNRSHFNLLPGIASSFNVLSNVLSKFRTWIHNSWMPGHLWTWRFSSYQSLSGSFSLIHSLCLNYSFLFTQSAENWNLLMSGSLNRWESSIDYAVESRT